MGFINVDPKTLENNFFKSIDKDWMLITAGSSEKCNTMTASWGGIGILWNKNVSFAFIRDSRYTMEFVDNNDYYTLSFFGGNFRKELTFCGRNSGRNVDKIKETGLTPVFDDKAPYFEEAELVLVCRKLFKQKMAPESFIDKEILEKTYADSDWHELFVGEIVAAFKKV